MAQAERFGYFPNILPVRFKDRNSLAGFNDNALLRGKLDLNQSYDYTQLLAECPEDYLKHYWFQAKRHITEYLDSIPQSVIQDKKTRLNYFKGPENRQLFPAIPNTLQKVMHSPDEARHLMGFSIVASELSRVYGRSDIWHQAEQLVAEPLKSPLLSEMAESVTDHALFGAQQMSYVLWRLSLNQPEYITAKTIGNEIRRAAEYLLESAGSVSPYEKRQEHPEPENIYHYAGQYGIVDVYRTHLADTRNFPFPQKIVFEAEDEDPSFDEDGEKWWTNGLWQEDIKSATFFPSSYEVETRVGDIVKNPTRLLFTLAHELAGHGSDWIFYSRTDQQYVQPWIKLDMIRALDKIHPDVHPITKYVEKKCRETGDADSITVWAEQFAELMSYMRVKPAWVRSQHPEVYIAALRYCVALDGHNLTTLEDRAETARKLLDIR